MGRRLCSYCQHETRHVDGACVRCGSRWDSPERKGERSRVIEWLYYLERTYPRHGAGDGLLMLERVGRAVRSNAWPPDAE